MTENVKRPSFSGDTAKTTERTTPMPDPSGLANSDVMPLKGDGALELTVDQRAAVLTSLFLPTVNRVCTLLSTVIQTGQNADMALWIPLAAIDATLRDLRWRDAPTENGLRLLELFVKTFRAYAEHLNTHMLDLAAWEGAGEQGERPTLRAWENEDTLRLYDEVERSRPLKALDRAALRDVLLLVIDETGLPGAELDIDRASNAEIATADAALMAVIGAWSDDECRAAQAWATAVHLQASDNPDVKVPPMPACIPPRAPAAPTTEAP